MTTVHRALLALLLAGATLAQAATLAGRVTAAGSDLGVEGVQLVVRPLGDVPDPIGFGLTGPEGFYEIPGLETGPSELAAIHPLHETRVDSLMIQPGLNVHDFELTPLDDEGEAWLAGWVFDLQSMLPLPGAELALTLADGQQFEAVSGPEGGFEFAGLAAGQVVLHAAALGHAGVELPVQLTPGPNSIEVGLWPLGEAASVTGWLFGANGEPVGGAAVQVFQPPFTQLETLSDPTGGFAFEGLGAGPAWFSVRAAGWFPLDEMRELAPGANTVELLLAPWDDPGGLAVIHGRVVDGLSLEPLAGALVELRTDPVSPPQLLVSDAEGFVTSDSLAAGPLLVRVERDGYQPFAGDAFLAPGLNELSWPLLPFVDPGEPASLAGTVLDAVTGAPLGGAFVLAMAGEGLPGEAVSGDDGSFFIDGLLSGEGFVHVDAPGHFPFDQPLALQPGANAIVCALEPFANEEPATVAVQLFDARTGVPVSGASLVLESPLYSLAGVTGPEGSCSWENVPGGFATLHAEHPDYYPEAGDVLVAAPLTSVAMGLTRLGDVPPGLTLVGTVLDLVTRLPLEDAAIAVFPDAGAGDTLFVAADPGGFFVLDLPPTDAPGWIVRAASVGHLPAEQWVPAIESGEFWVELLLMPENAPDGWGRFEGRVLDAAGAPLPGAELEAIPLDPAGGFSQYAQSGPDGSWTMPVVPGDYLLACRRWLPEGEPLTLYWPGVFDFGEALPLFVGPDETLADLDFQLPLDDGGTLSVVVDGRVLDEDGQPVEGAAIRFWTAAEELVDAATQTDADGLFQTTVVLDRLPIVPFSFSAQREGYELEFFSGSPSLMTATQFVFGGDGTIHNADFQLETAEAGLAVAGAVDGPDGAAPSALVAAFSPEGDFMRSVAADAAGGFAFDDLPDRPLALLYYAPGFVPVFSGGALSLDDAELVDPAAGLDRDALLVPVPAAAGPVAVSGHVVGVCNVERLPFLKFTPTAVRLFYLIADLGSSAIAKSTRFSAMQELSVVDPASGFHTAAYFEQRFRDELQRFKRAKVSFAFVSMRLDGYDTLAGILKGRIERLIREVAGLVFATKRDLDVVAQGADPGAFHMLLPVTDTEGAMTFARKVQRSVLARISLSSRTEKIRPTACFGIAVAGEGADTRETLERLADEALRAAVDEGPGKVRVGKADLR